MDTIENIKKKNFIINVAYIAIILGIVYFITKYLFKWISPFIVAFGIAFILKKPARYLSKKLNIPLKIVLVLMVFLFYFTLGLLIITMGTKLVAFLTALFTQMPEFYTQAIEPFLEKILASAQNLLYTIDPEIISSLNQNLSEIVKRLGQNISEISMTAVGLISTQVVKLPTFLIKTLITIIATFFIASDYEKVSVFIVNQFSERGKEILLKVKFYLVGTVWVCIKSYGLIMSITFLELSIGFAIIGVKHGISIALLIAVFDILPVFGTGGVMIPWALLTFLQGKTSLGISFVILYVVVTIVRNIIEPKIVGSQLGLHPVITLISIFLGVKFFGFIGLFGLPITVSTLKYLNDIGIVRLYTRNRQAV